MTIDFVNTHRFTIHLDLPVTEAQIIKGLVHGAVRVSEPTEAEVRAIVCSDCLLAYEDALKIPCTPLPLTTDADPGSSIN